jgi:hypothetical protein
MINLRYHIVSLTAVFLALAIGVLLGGTYLDKYTVDQLDQSITNAEERIRETRAENDRLRGEIGDAQARNQALIGGGTSTLFADNLTDVPVLVVAAEGADETSRRNLVQVLNASGAEFRGTLTVTGRIDLDDDQVADLAGRLDLGAEATADDVQAELIERFGVALAAAGTAIDPGNVDDPTGAPGDPSAPTTAPAGAPAPTTATPSTSADPVPSTTEPGGPGGPGGAVTTTSMPGPEPEPPAQPDIVTLMLETGLLSFEAPADPPTSGPLLSGTGYRYVFVSGAGAAVPDTTFLLPTLRRMAAEGPVPVVLASAAPDGDDRDAVVAGVRDDAELARLVSTVDNLEWFNGLVSTVLALDEIGRGARGHYGEGRGAAAPIPTGT